MFYIGENVVIKGDVKIGDNSSVWHNTTIRGDNNSIKIGNNTNIQDNCVVHVDKNCPANIGDNVTIGHGAIIHGCTIGNNCLIGMGAIILNGAVIEDNCLIGAGSLVTENGLIKNGSVAFGSPCMFKKEVDDNIIKMIKDNALNYVKEAKEELMEKNNIILKRGINMIDQNCAYCVEGELLDAFGIKICELETSKVYLFKEQSHLGRVVVAHKQHVGELVELSKEERAAYLEDVCKVANAVHEIFNPKKVNYGAYGDTGHHLHFHLVPKYEDGYEWGGVFAMNPKEKFLSDEEYKEIIEKYRKVLCK